MVKIIFKYENQVKEIEFQQNDKMKFSLRTSTLDDYSYENGKSYKKLLVINNLEISNLLLEKLIDSVESLESIQAFEIYIDGNLITKGDIAKESIRYRLGSENNPQNNYAINELLTCLVD